MSEWEDELPDLDLDVIVYANERHGLDASNWDKYSVARLKNKYPKAKVIGFIIRVSIENPKPDKKLKATNIFRNPCKTTLIKWIIE